ncbi:Ig-like domain-containing protein [Myxococcus sp. CA039A]|uniref:RCC1 domain-containing protein n=1 Tax=Myxococcus sp. CA039A TaxID=2741737 RepID=UPI00359CB675
MKHQLGRLSLSRSSARWLLRFACPPGFFPDIRCAILLGSWVLAACGGGGGEKPPPTPPANKAPVAVADRVRTDEDTAVVIPATTLVANDTDADGDSLAVTAVGNATQGTVTLAGGNVAFTPESNFFGMATFNYTVSDGTNTSTSTVTVTVQSVNDAPVASADSAVTRMNGGLTLPVAKLLANDSDVEGDGLTVSQVANAHHGTVELLGDEVKFTPTPGFAGAASFEYQVSDIHGTTATGSVAVRVRDDVPNSVVAGPLHTCAVFQDGRVKCWGFNEYGQLGLEDEASRGDAPGEMGGLLPFVRLGAGQKATSLHLGAYYTCALLERGAVKCWGWNVAGMLGLGDTERRGDAPGEMDDALPPVDLGTGRTAKALAANGSDYTCAILDDDTVKCWGDNQYGKLGLGDMRNRGDGPGEMGDALPTVDFGAGRTAKALAAGSGHTCALLDDGSVKCWGYNAFGQLGLGDKEDRGDGPDEMGDALPPVDLGAGRTARAIAAGGYSTCALLDDGSVKCWGYNEYGQLGLGDAEPRGDGPGEMAAALPPVNLGTGRTAKALSLGAFYTCALLDDGSVKCWGSNESGRLGLGDSKNRGQVPAQMGDALPPVNLGTGRTATSLTTGSHTCATLDDGDVTCWGDNDYGQLGLGDTRSRGENPGEMGAALLAVDF